MATIIAGLFATFAQAEDIRSELETAGIARDKVSIFVLNPAGQHALYPIGGDEDADPGARLDFDPRMAPKLVDADEAGKAPVR
jgi:hypothetical protein